MVHIFGDERVYFPGGAAGDHLEDQQQQQQTGNGGHNQNLNNNKNKNYNNGGGSSGSSKSGGNDNESFGQLHAILPPCPCPPCRPITWCYNENIRSSKLLRHDGHPCKVLLYPEEGWARTATNSYWLLSIPWWNRNRCKVVEVAGTRRNTTQAKVVDAGKGSVNVMGSFDKESSAEPDFKLTLTSQITTADANLGYLMTGTLERGHVINKSSNWQLTHFAVLRKYEWDV